MADSNTPEDNDYLNGLRGREAHPSSVDGKLGRLHRAAILGQTDQLLEERPNFSASEVDQLILQAEADGAPQGEVDQHKDHNVVSIEDRIQEKKPWHINLARAAAIGFVALGAILLINPGGEDLWEQGVVAVKSGAVVDRVAVVDARSTATNLRSIFDDEKLSYLIRSQDGRRTYAITLIVSEKPQALSLVDQLSQRLGNPEITNIFAAAAEKHSFPGSLEIALQLDER